MNKIVKFSISILLLMPVITGTIKAAEEVEIPFHLGMGKLLYEQYCGSCHGLQLTGSDKGPPLLHPFYKPSHHGDKAFYRAALQGAQQHHWEFGNMSPVEGMTTKKMDSLVPYVRYYQLQKKLY